MKSAIKSNKTNLNLKKKSLEVQRYIYRGMFLPNFITHCAAVYSEVSTDFHTHT